MSDIRIEGTKYGCGLSHEDRAALEEKASTDAIVARAAAAAGRRAGTLPLAPPATYRDTKASQQPLTHWEHDAKSIAIGGTHTALELVEAFSEKAAHRVASGMPLAAAAVMVEVAEMLPRAWEHGDEQNVALTKDARRLAIVFTLEGLPPTYVETEKKKRKEVTGTYQSPADVVAFKLRANKAITTVLQLRADEGMKVAEQCMTSQLPRETFWKTRPDLGRRYANDAAFQIGFDALMHAQAAGAAALDTALTALRKRDARCGSTFNLVFTG